MDALALLCNLHADGPATLQRLRKLGCEDLNAVAGLSDELLGAELRQDPGAAQRFKREALALAQRMHGGPAAGPAPAAAPAEGAGLDQSAAEAATTAHQEADAQPGGSAAFSAKEKILAVWREMDAAAARKTPPVSEPRPISEPLPEPSELGLDGIEMDGLTPELIERLRALGIEGVDALVQADGLKLSRDLPLAFTRVKRLQLLARRVRTERVLQEGSTVRVGQDPERVVELKPAVLANEQREPQAALAPAARGVAPGPAETQAAEPVPQPTEDPPTPSPAPGRAFSGRHPLVRGAHEEPERGSPGSAGPFA